MSCDCKMSTQVSSENLLSTSPKILATQKLVVLGRSLIRVARAVELLNREGAMTPIEAKLLNKARQLISNSIKALKESGANTKKLDVQIDRRFIALSEVLKRIPRVKEEDASHQPGSLRPLGVGDEAKPAGDKEKPDEPKGSIIVIVLAAAVALAAVIGKWIGEKIIDLFNASDDDDARKWASDATSEKVKAASDNDLVSMIGAMLDGPTGTDDENSILKLLELTPCERRIRIVNRVGQGRLEDDIDGSNWDRLMNLLVECGIVNFAAMDDDASRLFVNTHDCVQLGSLDMGNVRQLVLNMFSGSCGDDDENAILKLLRCQTMGRLHQLVRMPGTDVDEFDWKFDGDEWDDLDQLFRANGIALDP